MAKDANSLAVLDKASKMLARICSVSDAKATADLALAARDIARKANLGLSAQNHAAEVHLRAVREGGRLLRSMTKAKPGPKVRSHDETELPTLSDLGITKSQSHRWQTIAETPDEVFDEWLRKTHEGGKELTSKGAYKLGRQASKPAEEPEALLVVPSDETKSVATLEELGEERFGTIYADPPWKYGNQSTRASTDNHYSTMSVDELCDMPVEQYAADDAHLHLWTTNAFLPDAFRVMEAWGFEYRSCYVWVKPQMGIGNYWRVSHEFMLLGIRGNAKRFNNRSQLSWGQFDRTKHSAKPEEIRQIIEYVSPGPFLELFGRKLAPGWTVMGNQIERTMFDQAG